MTDGVPMTADQFDDWPCSWCGAPHVDHLDIGDAATLCLETPGRTYEPHPDWDPVAGGLDGIA